MPTRTFLLLFGKATQPRKICAQKPRFMIARQSDRYAVSWQVSPKSLFPNINYSGAPAVNELAGGDVCACCHKGCTTYDAVVGGGQNAIDGTIAIQLFDDILIL